MSKFRHETEGFNVEFHGWYNMEPPSLPGLPKANPMSSFSSIDSETPLKNIDQVRGRLDYETCVAEYWNHKLMKAKKELVHLNGKANEALYCASKQNTKDGMSGERIPFLNFELWQKRHDNIESYKCSWDRNFEMDEERNKGFKDFRWVAKKKEPHLLKWDSMKVKGVESFNEVWYR